MTVEVCLQNQTNYDFTHVGDYCHQSLIISFISKITQGPLQFCPFKYNDIIGLREVVCVLDEPMNRPNVRVTGSVAGVLHWIQVYSSFFVVVL